MSSINFSDVFEDHKWERVCADIGADGILMGETNPRCTESAGSQVDVHTPSQPIVVDMAVVTPGGTRTKLVCTEEAVVHIAVHVRQGTALKLPNGKWLVTSQHVSNPFLRAFCP